MKLFLEQKHYIETNYMGIQLKWLGGLSSYCSLNHYILVLNIHSVLDCLDTA